ncbi:MAG: glucosamine-6-phosphate deaminase [Opitutaceae bacterium]|nr:glucosamine-6-phosphate deaminase [Opitutaceae bacterium]
MCALTPFRSFSAGQARVSVYSTTQAMGLAAAESTSKIIRAAIAARGRARIMVATGNSQLEFIAALTRRTDVDWSRVETFHMDEYVGISAGHPSSFRYWLKHQVDQKVHPAQMHYIEGDAADLGAEIRRYAALLAAGPLDAAFVGFGENGHIAFNDPPVADFDDPAMLKVVELDEACRRQQVGEGHFKDLDSVPKRAISVTCSGLLRASAWICCVPERRKAEAVRQALEGSITTACPASVVRRHPHAQVFLDLASADRLTPTAA